MKDTYNRELDTRLMKRLSLDKNAIYTVRQFIEKLNKDRDIIYRVWLEEADALTEKRNNLFQEGLNKLLSQ